MALKSDQLPNRMLNGEEIRKIAVEHFNQMLTRDCLFLKQQAYRRCAFKLTAVFQFGSPLGEHIVEVIPPALSELERGLPLTLSRDDEGAPEKTVLVGLEREVSLDNPNLQRVAHGLPIIVTERKPPEPIVPMHPIPNEPPDAILNPFPTIVNREVRYHPEDFEKPPEPIDTNVTEREAVKLGVPAEPVTVPEPIKDRTSKRK